MKILPFPFSAEAFGGGGKNSIYFIVLLLWRTQKWNRITHHQFPPFFALARKRKLFFHAARTLFLQFAKIVERARIQCTVPSEKNKWFFSYSLFLFFFAQAYFFWGGRSPFPTFPGSKTKEAEKEKGRRESLAFGNFPLFFCELPLPEETKLVTTIQFIQELI